MGFIRVTSTAQGAQQKLRRIARALTPHEQDLVMRRVAWIWHSRMVLRTPKRWTGSTRQAWKVQPLTQGAQRGYRIVNASKVMRYLEQGTRAHGPTNAKRLFIPLTRRAAEAGPRGVLAAVSGGGRRRFVYGRDYVFAKRVRGITAMWIVRDALPFMRATARQAMVQFIQAVINAP
jgi:hypothetical protein